MAATGPTAQRFQVATSCRAWRIYSHPCASFQVLGVWAGRITAHGARNRARFRFEARIRGRWRTHTYMYNAHYSPPLKDQIKASIDTHRAERSTPHHGYKRSYLQLYSVSAWPSFSGNKRQLSPLVAAVHTQMNYWPLRHGASGLCRPGREPRRSISHCISLSLRYCTSHTSVWQNLPSILFWTALIAATRAAVAALLAAMTARFTCSSTLGRWKALSAALCAAWKNTMYLELGFMKQNWWCVCQRVQVSKIGGAVPARHAARPDRRAAMGSWEHRRPIRRTACRRCETCTSLTPASCLRARSPRSNGHWRSCTRQSRGSCPRSTPPSIDHHSCNGIWLN